MAWIRVLLVSDGSLAPRGGLQAVQEGSALLMLVPIPEESDQDLRALRIRQEHRLRDPRLGHDGR